MSRSGVVADEMDSIVALMSAKSVPEVFSVTDELKTEQNTTRSRPIHT